MSRRIPHRAHSLYSSGNRPVRNLSTSHRPRTQGGGAATYPNPDRRGGSGFPGLPGAPSGPKQGMRNKIISKGAKDASVHNPVSAGMIDLFRRINDVETDHREGKSEPHK